MEMKGMGYTKLLLLCAGAFALLLLSTRLKAQSAKMYTIKNGRMYIQLPKDIKQAALDSFVTQYDLADLDLKTFIKTNNADLLDKQGWQVELNNETGFILSKPFEPFQGLSRPDDKIFFKDRPDPMLPAPDQGITYGVNRFRNKLPFNVQDSTVRFFIRGHKDARRMMLAGSFNHWNPDQLPMKKTDSGWIFDVTLKPGKHWYKYIADGDWYVDKDNQLSENDGQGNINSVYYRPNIHVKLSGYTEARKVYLAGSFNDWDDKNLPMNKTATGWEVPVYLAEGTHTYKFVIDKKWYADPTNKETLPDGRGALNSVIRLGKPHIFRLDGYPDAKAVILAGSFNKWQEFELLMKKTATGWELPYTLGQGNYEYKFKVDGQWISDPANAMSSPSSGNSFLIINPNYTFRLKGFKDAKEVFLAGNFNNWDPRAYAMKREGDEWVFPVHLFPGKHLYKFIVDGNWIIDPGNKLWEQNEHNTGNSVIWIEQ
jgi:hypothetical protein